MLSFFPLTRIDTALMNYYDRYWKRQYRYLADEKREVLFRTTPDASSVWKNDQQEIILNRYNEKLYEFGLQ